MKLSELVNQLAKELGMYDPSVAKTAHLFAQSMNGPSAGDIELSEEEIPEMRRFFRELILDPKKRAENEARVDRIIQGN